MTFLRRIFTHELTGNFAVSIASLAFSVMVYLYNKEKQVDVSWAVFIGFFGLLFTLKFLSLAYLLHEKNNALNSENIVLKEKLKKESSMMPEILGYQALPKFKLVASKSPLFVSETEVTIFLQNEIYEGSETQLCHGKISHLYTTDGRMEVLISDSDFEDHYKNRLREIFTNKNNYRHIKVIPGKIEEQEL